jgi:S1-C subfamily serine protease
MKRLHAVPVCVVVLALALAQLCLASGLPEIVARVRPSIVGVGTAYPPRQPGRMINRIAYLGTGFVVGNGRQIITNAHVVEVKLDTDNNQSLAVFIGNGVNATARMARLAREDGEHDLVLLEIQGEPLPALELGNSNAVKEGQDIAFTGFPMGMALGLYPVTHRGIISAITPMAQPVNNSRALNSLQVSRMRGDFKAFQLDATAYPGNSGSPVFELDNGHVVGVINSVAIKETRETLLKSPSGITYAIPSRYIMPLLKAR